MRCEVGATLRAVTTSKRARHCGITPVAGAVSVNWAAGEAGARAHFGGLQSCSSPWICPGCSAKIQAGRAAEVGGAVEKWISAGHGVVFVTLTMRHRKGQGLKMLWDALSKSWSRVTRSASWAGSTRQVGLRQRYGIAGFIRAVEVTVGENGWHVHTHALLFTKSVLDEDEAKTFGDRLFARWSAAVQAQGLEAPLQRAQDVRVVDTAQSGVQQVGRYLAKNTYTGLGAEVSAGGWKTARKGNRTPFEVLACIHEAVSAGEEIDAEDLALWHEWERVSRGRRQVNFSRGLRDLLEVEERSDEELAETETAEEAEAEEIGRIAAEDWKRVLRPVSVRLEVLHAVEAERTREAAVKALRGALERLGVAMLPGVPKVLDTPPEDTCALPVVSDEDMAEHVRRLRSRHGRKGASAVLGTRRRQPASQLELDYAEQPAEQGALF